MFFLIVSLIFLLLFTLIGLKYLKTTLKTPPIVIGILTQPSCFPTIHSPENFHYIGDCYVDQLKAEGAVVVPIIITKSDKEIMQLVYKINGVLIPGGDVNLFDSSEIDGYNRFTQVAKLIVEYSISQWENNNKRVFPIWGTCQGFETLLIIASQRKSYEEILERFDHINISKSISIEKSLQSSMFNGMNQEQLDYSQRGSPYFYWHFYGISPEKFNEIDELGRKFQITSRSVNSKGREFVATFEGINGLPIYASQFHPERVFVWLKDRNINHTPMSYNTNQYFGKFLIEQAKKNCNCFYNDDELKAERIELNNYSLEQVPVSFMACYFFQTKN